MRILFVRHGQTNYNLENRVQGSSDIPLNYVGLSQASNVKLNSFQPDIGFHSGLSRSHKTLDLILQKNNISISTYKNILLQERKYGIFEGLTHNEIKERYPILYEEWKKNENILIHDAESIKDVQDRGKSFLYYVHDNFKTKQNILTVTHSGFMYALYKFLFNIDLNEKPNIHIDNCDIFDLYYEIE